MKTSKLRKKGRKVMVYDMEIGWVFNRADIIEFDKALETWRFTKFHSREAMLAYAELSAIGYRILSNDCLETAQYIAEKLPNESSLKSHAQDRIYDKLLEKLMKSNDIDDLKYISNFFRHKARPGDRRPILEHLFNIVKQWSDSNDLYFFYFVVYQNVPMPPVVERWESEPQKEIRAFIIEQMVRVIRQMVEENEIEHNISLDQAWHFIYRDDSLPEMKEILDSIGYIEIENRLRRP